MSIAVTEPKETTPWVSKKICKLSNLTPYAIPLLGVELLNSCVFIIKSLRFTTYQDLKVRPSPFAVWPLLSICYNVRKRQKMWSKYLFRFGFFHGHFTSFEFYPSDDCWKWEKWVFSVLIFESIVLFLV